MSSSDRARGCCPLATRPWSRSRCVAGGLAHGRKPWTVSPPKFLSRSPTTPFRMW